MSNPKQVGMSCKNTRFIKRGLTPSEQRRVEKVTIGDKAKWEWLFSPERNKWTKDGLPLTPKSRK